ncbi:hypothetical protein Tco_0459627 [Tanacetum coccineum]
MDLETAQNNVVAKLPLLKQGDYEMWKLRIEQYFQVQDYALWDVIENGNSFQPVPRITTNADGTSTSTIPARFGSNDAIRKTQKTLLKQMYENFNASSIESLDSIFNRLQKIISQLDILDLDIMSFDDLYNNFKIVEQEVKRTVSSSSNLSSQNVAFVLNDNTANLSDANVYAFLANQPNGSQLVHEDLEQIHEDDLEEMDLKWQLALLSMRAKRYYPKISLNKLIKDQFGIYKWYQSLCSETLIKKKQKVRSRNSHKEMDLEPTQNNAVAKLALLKQENGNSFQPVPQTTSKCIWKGKGAILLQQYQVQLLLKRNQKKNDVKARSIVVLMALPNEHLLTFSQYKDAKTLFEAIQARFGSNDAIRKTQKTLLKQMYENFNASSIESLDSIFNRH